MRSGRILGYSGNKLSLPLLTAGEGAIAIGRGGGRRFWVPCSLGLGLQLLRCLCLWVRGQGSAICLRATISLPICFDQVRNLSSVSRTTTATVLSQHTSFPMIKTVNLTLTSIRSLLGNRQITLRKTVRHTQTKRNPIIAYIFNVCFKKSGVNPFQNS